MQPPTHTPPAAAPAAAPRITGLQGIKRRVVFIVLYEVIAVAIASGIFMLMGQNGAESSSMAVIATTIALAWNLAFNWMFEQWESRQADTGRSLGRRLAHAVGFEGGLALILIPVIAFWFDVSFWEAFKLELGLLVFLFVYTFVFNWAFDRIFGLPASAQALSKAA